MAFCTAEGQDILRGDEEIPGIVACQIAPGGLSV
jgi:hypothetical protein